LSIFSLAVLISVSAAQAETYFPTDHAYNETRWGYDEDPCGKYDEIDISFFVDDNREVVSAKFYITAHYNFATTPPPPSENNSENNLKRRAAIGGCDESVVGYYGLVHPLFCHLYGCQPDTSMHLPDNKEIAIDVPPDNVGTHFGLTQVSLAYMKTNIFNQYVELTDARLEVVFR
jgi:hypothetical protein